MVTALFILTGLGLLLSSYLVYKLMDEIDGLKITVREMKSKGYYYNNRNNRKRK